MQAIPPEHNTERASEYVFDATPRGAVLVAALESEQC